MGEAFAMTMTEEAMNPKGFTPPKERFIYRVKYTKGQEVKFIGHLDMMRLFQRTIKRAGLPVAYSQGFNPHQILSFASPLTLGTTSEGEYGDFEMTERIEPHTIVESLNQVLPLGIQALDAVLIMGKTTSAMASIDGAEYEVFPDETMTKEMIEKHLPAFLAQKEMIAMKKTKSNHKEVDIRQDIFEMKDCSKLDETKIYLFLAAGSRRNLKPEPVMEGFYSYMGLPFPKYKIGYHRLELYRTHEDKMVGLAEGIGVRELAGVEDYE